MKRLREIRKHRKLEVLKVAPAIGIEPQNWWRYERGTSKPDWETASKIADALGVSLDQLVGRRPFPVGEDGQA